MHINQIGKRKEKYERFYLYALDKTKQIERVMFGILPESFTLQASRRLHLSFLEWHSYTVSKFDL